METINGVLRKTHPILVYSENGNSRYAVLPKGTKVVIYPRLATLWKAEICGGFYKGWCFYVTIKEMARLVAEDLS